MSSRFYAVSALSLFCVTMAMQLACLTHFAANPSLTIGEATITSFGETRLNLEIGDATFHPRVNRELPTIVAPKVETMSAALAAKNWRESAALRHTLQNGMCVAMR